MAEIMTHVHLEISLNNDQSVVQSTVPVLADLEQKLKLIDKGWINIVLFYSNFLSLRGSVVLMSTYSMDYIIFIPSSLISLQLGVGLCFHDGMTPLAKIRLQLVFPVYLYILMAIFALLC